MRASASTEQTGYTFDALKTYVPEMVELLVDCVRNPFFLDWEVRCRSFSLLKASRMLSSSYSLNMAIWALLKEKKWLYVISYLKVDTFMVVLWNSPNMLSVDFFCF